MYATLICFIFTAFILVVFGNSLFIHGGYDVDHGIIGDFYEMDLS